MRKRVWFKVLDRMERAIISLTIRCAERVRSSKLAEIVRSIVDKLIDAMKSRVERLVEKVGPTLAQNIAWLASLWGNREAKKWAADTKFMRYLTVMELNTPKMFNASAFTSLE